MHHNKKSFLVTVVETSLLVWLLKAVGAGLIQAVVFCFAKKKIEGEKKN